MLGIESAAKEIQRTYDYLLEGFREFKNMWRWTHGNEPLPEVVPAEFKRWIIK